MPLCKELYERLRRCFGTVRIKHPDEPLKVEYGALNERGFRDIRILFRGETYCVNCPFCNDRRQRLYINHRWCQWDPRAGRSYYFLAHCFNEDCLARSGTREALRSMVFGRTARPAQISTVPASPLVCVQQVSPTLPGPVTNLVSLPEDHHAKVYLRHRGFDPNELGQALQVGFCAEAREEFQLATNRIIIPSFMHGKLAGWQARYIGERDWKACQFPKYYSMPGMSRSRMLYNFDCASQSPYVVLTEGPMDVWAVGRPAVATFGKCISPEQKRLIASTWHHGCVIVLLDPDAKDKTFEITRELRDVVRKVVPVLYEDTHDPGSLPRWKIWNFIQQSLTRVGVDLTTFSRVETKVSKEAICEVH